MVEMKVEKLDKMLAVSKARYLVERKVVLTVD